MYIRITRAQFDPARADEMMSITRDTITAVQRQPGFRSVVTGLDRSGGTAVIVTTWDTEEHARLDRAALGDVVPRLQALGAQMEAAAIYEVVAQA